jgi:threonine aldolase
MEAALFFPSGVQANQAAILLHTEPGTELVLEADAHLVHYELAAVAALAGVQIRPVTTPDGLLTGDLVCQALRPTAWYLPRVTAVTVENTHNAAGGKVMPLPVWDDLVTVTRDRGLPLHLDGARIWNAASALDVSPARVARGATSVMVSLSKGLGCPVGSCLAGDAQLVERARTVRRRLGGGMRQTGILAAAGLYALDHHLERLGEDHLLASMLAELLQGHSAVKPMKPQTNIVLLDLQGVHASAVAVQSHLASAGVLLSVFGATRLRAVTHRDLTPQAVRLAGERIADVLAVHGG